jgi:hypothetical protein
LYGVMNGKVSGKADLQPHQQRQHERNEPHTDRHAAVLDRDDLVVLAPDVLLDEGRGIVQMVVTIGDCDVCHDGSFLSKKPASSTHRLCFYDFLARLLRQRVASSSAACLCMR